MTLAFRRVGGGIQLEVQAWQVRELGRNKRLPKPGFKRPYRVTLR